MNNKWLEFCYDLVYDFIPEQYGDNASAYSSFRLISDHALCVATHYKDFFKEDENKQLEVGAFFLGIGEGFIMLGLFDDALIAYMHSKDICEKFLEHNHGSTALVYNNIANVYREKGEYETALDWFFKALEIDIITEGEADISTAQTINNIATVLSALGKHKEAIDRFLKALHVFEKQSDADELGISTIYTNLSAEYSLEKMYHNAIEWALKALKIDEKCYGINHPNIATTYNNIGLYHYCTKDYESASFWFQKALEVRKNIFGDYNIQTATIYYNLANTYYQQGSNFIEAIDMLKKSYHIRKKYLGISHPHTQLVLLAMKKYYAEMNEILPFEKWLKVVENNES